MVTENKAIYFNHMDENIICLGFAVFLSLNKIVFMLFIYFFSYSCTFSHHFINTVELQWPDGWLVVLLFNVHSKHLRSCRDGQWLNLVGWLVLGLTAL